MHLHITVGIQLPHGDIALAAAGAVHHLADQLAAGRIDVFTTGGAHGDVVAGMMQVVLKTTDSVVAWPLVTRVRERVERDQVDLARYVLEQLGHFHGVFELVVNVLEQGVLNGQYALFAELRHVAHARFEQYLERVLLVDRHQLVAQRIVRRVQRQG
ncbi:hypothetical protein D3C72_1897430 [compost metagenome]